MKRYERVRKIPLHERPQDWASDSHKNRYCFWIYLLYTCTPECSVQFSLFMHPDQAQNTLSGIQRQEATAVAVIYVTTPTSSRKTTKYKWNTIAKMQQKTYIVKTVIRLRQCQQSSHKHILETLPPPKVHSKLCLETLLLHRQALQGLDNMRWHSTYAWPTHFSSPKSTIKQTNKQLKNETHVQTASG